MSLQTKIMEIKLEIIYQTFKMENLKYSEAIC